MKPYGQQDTEVLSSGTKGATFNTSASETHDFANIVAYLVVSGVAGQSPTLDVKFQDSPDGTNWVDIPSGAFTQATGAGVKRLALSNTGPFIRAVNTIGGTATAAPGSAPTTAVNATAGNLNGDYLYKVTYVTATGETTPSAAATLVQPANQQVDLSAIPTGGSDVTARKIYRTAAGGSTYKLVTTINDNTTTTYTDNLADGSLGANAPSSNTATSGATYTLTVCGRQVSNYS